MNHEKMKSALFQALQEAGKIITSSLENRPVIEKKSELSLVTATDKAAESKILEVLGGAFPDHAFLTEESPPSGSSSSRWIIDPLDGTTNFAHTYPVGCVSIGYEEEGILRLGGVYDPFRNELFFGEKGKGATLNGRPIRVSDNARLSQSLLATGFPYDRREKPETYLAIVKDYMMRIHGIRRSGAAAIDLCYVACGRFDGFWEFQLQPWDKAAGIVIIEEAGGKVSDFSGNPMTLDGGQNVASNALIHEEMLEVLKPYKELRRKLGESL